MDSEISILEIKRLLFQISPLHYFGQQSYCRSTPSLCSMYPIHDRTNGYNGSLWFYQIWDTNFHLKRYFKDCFLKSLKYYDYLSPY